MLESPREGVLRRRNATEKAVATAKPLTKNCSYMQRYSKTCAVKHGRLSKVHIAEDPVISETAKVRWGVDVVAHSACMRDWIITSGEGRPGPSTMVG